MAEPALYTGAFRPGAMERRPTFRVGRSGRRSWKRRNRRLRVEDAAAALAVPHSLPGGRGGSRTGAAPCGGEAAAAASPSARSTSMQRRRHPEPPVPRPRVRWWVPVSPCLMGGVLGASLYELWTFSSAAPLTELYPRCQARGKRQIAPSSPGDAAASKTTGATTRAAGRERDGSVHRDIPTHRGPVTNRPLPVYAGQLRTRTPPGAVRQRPGGERGTLRLVPTPRLARSVAAAVVGRSTLQRRRRRRPRQRRSQKPPVRVSRSGSKCSPRYPPASARD